MKEQAAMLLQAVSRFHLGEDVGAHRAQSMQVEPASIMPIKIKPSAAALSHAYSGAAQSGQWQEY
jgi:hypothetical protein